VFGPIAAVAPPGVITPSQPEGTTVGHFHQIPYKFNEKWVGIILWTRQAKGAGPPRLS
jgi:hypothetical protein